MMKLEMRARGHFVMLIEICVHLKTCISEHTQVYKHDAGVAQW